MNYVFPRRLFLSFSSEVNGGRKTEGWYCGGLAKEILNKWERKKNEKTGLGNENEGGFDKVCVLFLVAFGLLLPILENFFKRKKLQPELLVEYKF